MPSRVRASVVLLWIAWCSSASALAAHLVESGGSDADSYSRAAIPAAVAQAVLIYSIGKRRNAARVLMLWLAIPALAIVLLWFLGSVSMLRLGLETSLRAGALVLLLTRESAAWFHGEGSVA